MPIHMPIITYAYSVLLFSSLFLLHAICRAAERCSVVNVQHIVNNTFDNHWQKSTVSNVNIGGNCSSPQKLNCDNDVVLLFLV